MSQKENLDTADAGQKEDILQTFDSDILPLVVDVFLNLLIPLIVSVFGVATNLINICIFWKLDLRDSMSINVFALSMADFLTTFLNTAACLCLATDILFPAGKVNTWSMGYVTFAWIENALYMSSCWITAVIAIERCFCVVFPFKVKQIFTRSGSVVAVLIIYTVHIVLYVPMFLIHKISWPELCPMKIVNCNITNTKVRIFTMLFDGETEKFDKIFDTTVTLALNDVSFIVAIGCTIYMSYKLKVSSKIRGAKCAELADVPSQRSKLSNKERKLVKVALALVTTLLACSLPRVLVVSAQSSIPNGHITPLPWFINIMWAVAYIFTTIGCSITIFLYLSLNSNYRVVFKQLFQCRSNMS